MFRFVNRLELQCVRLMCFGVRRSVRFVLLLKGREPSLRSCTHGDTRTAVESTDLQIFGVTRTAVESTDFQTFGVTRTVVEATELLELQ